MKIGVIGFKGFIGSHLLNIDLEGFDFLGLSLSPNWKNDKNYILDIDGLDVIINAAGSADVSNSFNFPDHDFDSNVYLPIYILNTIFNKNKKIKFLNFSSAAVYGNPEKLPITINHEINPISPYGFNKFISEQVIKSYFDYFKINTISLRVFSCYGNGNSKQVLWELCKKAKMSNDGNLLVLGKESDSRDFIHISDLLNQVILLLKNQYLFDGRPINIANGTQVEIGTLARIVAREFHCKNVKFSGQDMLGYPSNWQAEINLLIKLGYIQNVNIEEGVINYCNWFKKNYEI